MQVLLPHVARTAGLGCLLLLGQGTRAQTLTPTFTLFGTGCPSGNGIAALHNNGLPALGFPMQIDLTQAAPNGFAVLIIAAQRIQPPIDLAFIGAPGCALHVLPPIDVSVGTSSTGTAAVTFTVPNNLGLTGASVHTQWVAVAATLQISTSNGGTALLAPQPAAISPPTVIAPPSGPVGTAIVIRTRNLGTNRPDDICIRLMDPATNGVSLLRVTGIATDMMTGEDVITTRLATVATRGGPVQAQIGMMRGGGAVPPTNSSTCLNAPISAWAWQGTSLPGNGANVPTAFVATPSANRLAVPLIYDAGTNSLYVDVPLYPFGGPGTYPPNAGITTDAHGDIQCGGGVPNCHFDHFLETATVKAACNISNQTVATEHAPQLQQAFANVFGAGRLTITAETAGSMARIRIRPTNAGCTLLGGGGSLVITQ